MTAQVVDRRTAFALGICDMEWKAQSFQDQHPERLRLYLELATRRATEQDGTGAWY